MNWPAVLQTKTRRVFALFALAELSLVLAIPFLAVAGTHAVLDSRSGAFVQQLGPDEPGWLALVEPSAITMVVERHEGQTTGVTLLVREQNVPGGAVVILSGDVEVGDVALAELDPEEVVAAISEALRLNINQAELVDEAMWSQVIGSRDYTVTNPDVVEAESGESFAVGEVEVSGDNAGDFVGSTNQRSNLNVLLSRRKVLWSAMVDSPPDTDHPVAIELREIATSTIDIFEFPSSQSGRDSVLGEQEAAALVARAVPFPAGAEPHHRIQLRILDRTGEADLPAIASELAASGFEIVEMGNAQEFDNGPSELVVPSQWAGPDPSPVAEFADVDSVIKTVEEPESVATLLIGDDFSLISA